MEELQFQTWSTVFYHCQVEVGGNIYSSGLVTERPWTSMELEQALPAVREAFVTVQHRDPQMLQGLAAAMLPEGADQNALQKCELVSLSAFWGADATSPQISLAFGFDDGVYFTASMRDGVVTSAELSD
ncbi:hypothetical protein B2J88_52325 [Rhodococcus sp. SRB_17]|nr:hypothetical protein [Rhodococcus sp. SRB_17]